MKKYWTIVFEESNKPVLPYDCSMSDCEGMLVYCSKKDAEAAMEHQKELYFSDPGDEKLIVVELGKENCCERIKEHHESNKEK